MDRIGSNFTGRHLSPPPDLFPCGTLLVFLLPRLHRPKSDDVTLSLLKRAADNGYSALVLTLDTMQIGWRPGDLKNGYLPFAHGMGSQVGFSDPVFMAKHGLPVNHQHPTFPYDSELLETIIRSDTHSALADTVRATSAVSLDWITEICSGMFRSWADVQLIRNNWRGPLILKGSVPKFLRPYMDWVLSIMTSN